MVALLAIKLVFDDVALLMAVLLIAAVVSVVRVTTTVGILGFRTHLSMLIPLQQTMSQESCPYET